MKKLLSALLAALMLLTLASAALSWLSVVRFMAGRQD